MAGRGAVEGFSRARMAVVRVVVIDQTWTRLATTGSEVAFSSGPRGGFWPAAASWARRR